MPLRERYDRTEVRQLTETEKHLRDSVWSRLSAGGIGLPSSITGVAALVVTGLPKKLEDALPELRSMANTMAWFVENPPEIAKTLVTIFLKRNISDYLNDALKFKKMMGDNVTDRFEFFKWCWPGLGFDRSDPPNCGAGTTLLLASILLVTIWITAVWQAYADGPRHVTMPRRSFLLACMISVSGFILIVNALLLDLRPTMLPWLFK